MTVRHMAHPGVHSIRAEASIRAAAAAMRDGRVGMLVVVRQGDPVGVVTDRDLAVRALADHLDLDLTPVSSVMTLPPVTVREDDSLEHAVALLRRTGHRRLLVVSGHGRPCGVLSSDDVTRRLAEAFRGLGQLVSQVTARPLQVAP